MGGSMGVQGAGSSGYGMRSAGIQGSNPYGSAMMGNSYSPYGVSPYSYQSQYAQPSYSRQYTQPAYQQQSYNPYSGGSGLSNLLSMLMGRMGTGTTQQTAPTVQAPQVQTPPPAQVQSPVQPPPTTPQAMGIGSTGVTPSGARYTVSNVPTYRQQWQPTANPTVVSSPYGGTKDIGQWTAVNGVADPNTTAPVSQLNQTYMFPESNWMAPQNFTSPWLPYSHLNTRR